MRTIARYALLGALAALLLSCDRGADRTILYLLNVDAVTVTEFRRDYEEWLVSSGQADGPELRRAFLDSRLMEDIFYEKGKLEGIEYLPEVREGIEECRQRLIVEKTRELVDRSLFPIDETAIKQYYVEHRDEFMRDKLYRLYAVRTKDKERAYEAYRKIAEGGFSIRLISAQYSDDRRLADMNGDWGLFSEDVMDPAWREAVVARKIGDIVGPVRDGERYWTVVELAGYAYRRELPLERAYQLIVRDLMRQEGDEKRRAHRERLYREYGVRVNEENLSWETP